MLECGFFRKIKGANCRHSRFEARNESPMMRKCEFRMQENPKLLQSEFERSEALGLGSKHSNLSPVHLNLAHLLGPFKPKPMQAWLEEAPASMIRHTPDR